MLSNRLKVQLSLSGKHSDTTGMLYLLQTVSEARVIWVDKSCCMIRHVFFFFFFFKSNNAWDCVSLRHTRGIQYKYKLVGGNMYV